MVVQLLAQACGIKQHGKQVNAALFTEIKQHGQGRPKQFPTQPVGVGKAPEQAGLAPYQQGVWGEFQAQQGCLQE